MLILFAIFGNFLQFSGFKKSWWRKLCTCYI